MRPFCAINKIHSKQPFLSLLNANAAFVTLVVLFLPFRYETMDDRYYLAWVTSGYLTGIPDYHTLFMNVIYGWLESRLYSIVPSIEWHTWLLLAVHVISVSSIGLCLTKSCHSRVIKIFSFVMLYLLETYLLTNLQFTTTAGLAATAGILLIIGEKCYWMGCALFILASMIRYPSAMFCGIITAAFYPLLILEQGFQWKQLFALVLCSIAAICLQFIDRQVYLNSPEWKEKYEFNQLRGSVFDNSNTWRIYINPPEGLQSRDFDVMGTISDTIEWTQNVYHKCLDEIEKQTTWHGIRGIKKVKNVPNELFQFWLWFLALIPINVCCLLNIKGVREMIAYLVGIMSLPVAMAVVALNTRLVLHAFLCGWIPVFFLSICIVQIKKETLSSIWLALAMLLLLPSIIPLLHLGQSTSMNLFQQQMELVRKGEQDGARCFVIDCKTEKCEYPFGIRYRFNNPDTKVEQLDNVAYDMVNNDKYVFLLGKEAAGNVIEGLENKLQRQAFQSAIIHVKTLSVNGDYSLFRLETLP